MSQNPAVAELLGTSRDGTAGWPDRSPDAIRAYEAASERLRVDLARIRPAALPPGGPPLHAALLERLEARSQLVACQLPLWASISHMDGWHLGLADAAADQPVSTPLQRTRALERWTAFPRFVEQEIANARAGLSRGFSSPQSVVRKVIVQVDRLLGADAAGALLSPAARSDDTAFQQRYRVVLAEHVTPALRAYRRFLEAEYLPQARTALGLSAHPEGARCYDALLRRHTTLGRTASEVYRLGQATVTANERDVRELGRSAFGTSDLASVVARADAASDNLFSSESELIAFSREVVQRARQRSIPFFMSLPGQDIRVEPIPGLQRGSGASAYYEPSFDPQLPAFYRINSQAWDRERRGPAEVNAVHEALPGHHLQISRALFASRTPVMRLLSNAAYVEGWGRYAEALAEEAGIYATRYALIARRLWPARGMVADPGLHVFGWSREQVVEFFLVSGRFARPEAEDLVDRMAVLPGQLTAYDSGYLEILALRTEARAALGSAFDIRDFHERLLENGTIPLSALRTHVRNWLQTEARRPAR